ncbi:WXG100 family type VII secretion target [Nocardia carnea]|uniref:WXG100 family type VII secretion target n=1 Tax=Nocardia carnea TaxID=37328 RepID=UPI0024537AFE|nr:hypothetical protein [Nocardia carnea]
MKYDPNILGPLIQDLESLRDKLRVDAENLQAAAGKLAIAWDGNAGYEGFRDAKNRFDAEFGTEYSDNTVVDETTIGKLNGIGKAVEAAWQNALGTDAKIGASFGG